MPKKTAPEKDFTSMSMFLGLLIVASSFGLVTYARRSQTLLKRMASNETNRVSTRADFGRQGPLTEKDTLKKRVDKSDDFF